MQPPSAHAPWIVLNPFDSEKFLANVVHHFVLPEFLPNYKVSIRLSQIQGTVYLDITNSSKSFSEYFLVGSYKISPTQNELFLFLNDRRLVELLLDFTTDPDRAKSELFWWSSNWRNLEKKSIEPQDFLYLKDSFSYTSQILYTIPSNERLPDLLESIYFAYQITVPKDSQFEISLIRDPEGNVVLSVYNKVKAVLNNMPMGSWTFAETSESKNIRVELSISFVAHTILRFVDPVRALSSDWTKVESSES